MSECRATSVAPLRKWAAEGMVLRADCSSMSEPKPKRVTVRVAGVTSLYTHTHTSHTQTHITSHTSHTSHHITSLYTHTHTHIHHLTYITYITYIHIIRVTGRESCTPGGFERTCRRSE